jgi:hypothetical protein
LNTLADAVNVSNAGDIFVLQRGSGYPNQGTINVSLPITIRASDGDGDLPLIAVAPDAAGAFAGTVLSLFADIRLENIAFTGIRDASRTARIGQVLQMFADDLRVEIDGCSFVGFGGRTLEPGRDGATLIVRNSIETGNGRSNRVDNGRFIDFRAASVDTVILQNNTLLNCADRWIRHMLEDASANYMLIDHNTFMNGTGYRPSFQFRNVRELYFVNNLVINPSIMGTTAAAPRKVEIEYTDPFEVICTFTMAGADTSNEVLVMENNNVWRDPRIDDILGDFDLANGDSVAIAPLFDAAFASRIDEATAVFSEELNFVQDVTIDSILPELEIYVGGTLGFSHSAFIFRTDELADGVNMNYGTTAQSYTAAAGGFPLGDLNWYPTEKQAWIAAGMPITSVENENPGTPETFRLSQNYPNPFNPTTRIAYAVGKNSPVKLTVYNLMGQEIKTLVNRNQVAGEYEAEWDGTDAKGLKVASGVYVYRLETSAQVLSNKMVLLK